MVEEESHDGAEGVGTAVGAGLSVGQPSAVAVFIMALTALCLFLPEVNWVCSSCPTAGRWPRMGLPGWPAR